MMRYCSCGVRSEFLREFEGHVRTESCEECTAKVYGLHMLIRDQQEMAGELAARLIEEEAKNRELELYVEKLEKKLGENDRRNAGSKPGTNGESRLARRRNRDDRPE